jgi:hypothetical protein
MANKGLEAGSTFLQGVLKTLSPEDRARAEEAVNTLRAVGNGAVVAGIGDGTLGQSEVSRQLSELQTRTTELETRRQEIDDRAAHYDEVHQQQTQWWNANRDALAEYTQMKKTPAPVLTPSNTPAPGMVTEEAFNERLQGATAGFLGLIADQTDLTREHFARFGEVVDVRPLLTHPQIGAVGLKGVYQLVHKDRLEKHQTDAALAAENKIRADERAKVLAQQAEMPYLPATGAGSGSPLDGLVQKDNVVDSAMAEYNRLVAARQSAGGA